MPENCIIVDDSNLPILEVSYHGAPTPAENQKYRDTIENLWAKNQRYVVVSDMSKAGREDKAENDKLVAWTKDNRDSLEKYCVASAMIVPNAMLRAVLRTFFFISKPPFPYIVTEDRAEGLAFVKEKLVKVGIQV